MSYWWLRQEWLGDGYMEEEGSTCRGVRLRKGCLIDFRPDKPITFTTTPPGHPAPTPGRYPPHLEDGSVPAMSGALLRALSAAGVDNLQIWPAIVRNPISGRLWDDYVVFNVVGLVDCVDLAASQGTTIMEGDTDRGGVPPLVDLTKIVLRKNIVTDLLMFREPIKGSLIVGDKVRNTLKATPAPDNGKWEIRLTKLESSS